MEDLLDVIAEILPSGWEVDDETTLVCPCGYVLETDGTCPNGCESPLREQGLI